MWELWWVYEMVVGMMLGYGNCGGIWVCRMDVGMVVGFGNDGWVLECWSGCGKWLWGAGMVTRV